MKAVALTRVVSDHDDTTIKIDPSHGFVVGACFTDNGVAPDLCMVLTAFGSFKVRGTVEEVSAALESATAPPVAAAVEVAPTDLEMAALILQVVAGEIDDQELEQLAARVNSKIGTRYDIDCHDGAISRLYALAAKLRGGG